MRVVPILYHPLERSPMNGLFQHIEYLVHQVSAELLYQLDCRRIINFGERASRLWGTNFNTIDIHSTQFGK